VEVIQKSNYRQWTGSQWKKKSTHLRFNCRPKDIFKHQTNGCGV